MTSQTALTIDEFKITRETRRAVLLVEYRKLVGALVQDDSMQTESAEKLDDIMSRLSISDDLLATDIEDTKQHRKLSKSISEFRAKQPQLEKKLQGLTEAIAKARSELEVADKRLNNAVGERQAAGQQHNKNRGDVTRKQELESRNPRVFGPTEHE